MPQQLTDQIAANKIALTGLPDDAGEKISRTPGRAACGSALRCRAHSPWIPRSCFSTSPPQGLYAIAADAFEALIKALQISLGLISTHCSRCDASPYWSTRRSASAPWSSYSTKPCVRAYLSTRSVRVRGKGGWPSTAITLEPANIVRPRKILATPYSSTRFPADI